MSLRQSRLAARLVALSTAVLTTALASSAYAETTAPAETTVSAETTSEPATPDPTSAAAPEATAPESATTTPQTSAPAAPKATPSTATPEPTTSAAGYDPEGRIDGYFWSSDGVIQIVGFAFDRDDLSKKVPIMTKVDGKATWWAYASSRSPQLDPYGLPYNGFRGVSAPAGAHTVCQYAINEIGGGSTQLLGCIDVAPPSIDPTGDMTVSTSGSNILINGWVIDHSRVYDPVGVWIVDNGTVVAQFMANAPSPYLNPYGIPGNHGFGMNYAPTTSGSHDICVYALNNGSGNSVWLGCKTVSVTAAPPVNHDPVGDVDVYAGEQGHIWLDAYAYDPDAPNQSLEVIIFVDGQPEGPYPANQDSAYLNPYGVYGNHGFYIDYGMPGEYAANGSEFCLHAKNVGLGADKLIKCVTYQQ